MVQNQFEIEEKHYQITITILAFHVQAQPKSNNFPKDFIFFRNENKQKANKKCYNSALFFIDSARPSTGRVQKTCVPSPQAFNGHISNKNKQLEAKAKIT